MKKRKPLTVGITGGIGSGKSTVCKIFEELGAKVINADIMAKEIMENDEKIKAKIRKIFGKNAYIGENLNRKFIADIIFSDKEKKKQLESIVHPAVIKKIIDEIKNTDQLIIVEAALIFETGFDKYLDYVIVVDAEREKRIQRIIERDKCSRNDAIRRMRSQMSDSEKRKLADIVIENNGTIDELRQKVNFVYNLLLTLSESKREGNANI